MAIPVAVKHYLFNNDVRYSHQTHQPTYAARMVGARHVFAGQFAKTVVLKTESRLIMTVLPGGRVINLPALKQQLGCDALVLATETEFVAKFPTCEPGAMPPFGKLFQLPIYCDIALATQDEIEFNAGTYSDTIRMKFVDFKNLEDPVMLSFSEAWGGLRPARIA